MLSTSEDDFSPPENQQTTTQKLQNLLSNDFNKIAFDNIFTFYILTLKNVFVNTKILILSFLYATIINKRRNYDKLSCRVICNFRRQAYDKP